MYALSSRVAVCVKGLRRESGEGRERREEGAKRREQRGGRREQRGGRREEGGRRREEGGERVRQQKRVGETTLCTFPLVNFGTVLPCPILAAAAAL